MEDILKSAVDFLDAGEHVALASLVESGGSIPMSERAKMLVRQDGSALGTIGGGCLEAEIVSTCSEVLADGRQRTTRYTMTEKQAGESGLNCGGTVRIYSERLTGEIDADWLGSLMDARETRRTCILATALSDLGGPRKVVYYGDGTQHGSLGTEAADEAIAEHAPAVIKGEKPQVVRLDRSAWSSAMGDGDDSAIEIFLEPFMPPPALHIFGGGHVGREIGQLAKSVGFRVVLIDDRPAFADPQRHPYADECLVEEMDKAFSRLVVDDQSFVVAATRGHEHDEVVVEHAIRTPARYIGMLGSERKKQILWKRIKERGGDAARLEEIYSPIGFNIGADNPQEIAVSVVAELIRARRGIRKVWKTKREAAAV